MQVTSEPMGYQVTSNQAPPQLQLCWAPKSYRYSLKTLCTTGSEHEVRQERMAGCAGTSGSRTTKHKSKPALAKSTKSAKLTKSAPKSAKATAGKSSSKSSGKSSDKASGDRSD